MPRNPILFFQQPYPFGGSLAQKLRENAWIGAFVAFFLIVFQPFGTAEWQSPYKYPFLLGYGIVSFVASMLVHAGVILRSGTEKLEKIWTVGREITLNTVLLMAIALGNMLYSNWMGIAQISLFSLLTWMGIVVLIGIFPLAAGILLRSQQYASLNRQEAAKMENNLLQLQAEPAKQTQPDTMQLSFVADNEKDKLALLTSEFLLVETADNYANFVFLKNGTVQKRLLRGALKRFEDQIGEHPSIVRCHRSYIVNLAQVAHAFGNAQGYRLSLRQPGLEVPVARNYGPAVLDRLKALAR